MSYVSIQSFMSIEQSVKEFTFISYFLFYHNYCDSYASAPLATKLPVTPDRPPRTTVRSYKEAWDPY